MSVHAHFTGVHRATDVCSDRPVSDLPHRLGNRSPIRLDTVRHFARKMHQRLLAIHGSLRKQNWTFLGNSFSVDNYEELQLVLCQFGFVGLLEFKAKLCLSLNKAQRRTPTTRQSYLDKVLVQESGNFHTILL